MAAVSKTCKCGEEMVEVPGCGILECRCGNVRSLPRKRERGYWTAGGEDKWTSGEVEDGRAPSNAYYVSYQGDE